MGCDDVPDNLFPKVMRDPTMRDIEILKARVEELERVVGILRDSPWSPVRTLLGNRLDDRQEGS